MSPTVIIDSTPTVKQNFTLKDQTSYKPKDVLARLKSKHQMLSVKDFTPAIVEPEIPEGADPEFWIKMLKNVGKPKRKRTSRHAPSKRCNHAASVIGRDRALQVAL